MNIVLVSSAGQCGIHECAQIMLHGFRERGHSARFIGIQRQSNADLRQQMRRLDGQDEVVIFEYEPGIFWPYGLIREMFRVRFLLGKKLILSIHEFSPDKFAEYRVSQALWSTKARFGGMRELVRALGLTSLVAIRYIRLRIALLLLAWLPNALIVHSEKTATNLEVGLPRSKFDKVLTAPLAVEPALGDRNEAREALGLPLDPFVFIIPGFIFRRKRIIEVIDQLPSGPELWIVGVVPDWEKEYVIEVQAHLKQSPKANQVRIIQEYGIEPYIQASDVVVLYYQEIFQSAVASQAAGAGKPCIFSDLAGFAPFESAGIIVRSPLELRQAMIEIQNPSCYRSLAEATRSLREELSPARITDQYLEALK